MRFDRSKRCDKILRISNRSSTNSETDRGVLLFKAKKKRFQQKAFESPTSRATPPGKNSSTYDTLSGAPRTVQYETENNLHSFPFDQKEGESQYICNIRPRKNIVSCPFFGFSRELRTYGMNMRRLPQRGSLFFLLFLLNFFFPSFYVYSYTYIQTLLGYDRLWLFYVRTFNTYSPLPPPQKK